jgi:D-3-phosphoglycerate dehydrogenase
LLPNIVRPLARCRHRPETPIHPGYLEREPVPQVLIYDPIVTLPWDYDTEREALREHGVELVIPANPSEAVAALPDADVVVVSQRIPNEHLELARNCCGICCYSVGMDGVDAALASGMGISVTNVPDYCTEDVADHAVALLLALQRCIVPFAVQAAAGRWSVRDRSEFYQIRRLRGQTVGVVGVGRIGTRVAEKCSGIGMTPIGYDPDRTAGPAGVPLVDLPELLSRSDAIVLCAALTDGNRRIIDAAALQQMRPHCTVVNVARGGLVDETALAEALRSGRIRAAGLDVRDPEPPDPVLDPLRDLPNVVLTQHVAATSMEAFTDIRRLAARQILALLRDAGRLAGAGVH